MIDEMKLAKINKEIYSLNQEILNKISAPATPMKGFSYILLFSTILFIAIYSFFNDSSIPYHYPKFTLFFAAIYAFTGSFYFFTTKSVNIFDTSSNSEHILALIVSFVLSFVSFLFTWGLLYGFHYLLIDSGGISIQTVYEANTFIAGLTLLCFVFFVFQLVTQKMIKSEKEPYFLSKKAEKQHLKDSFAVSDLANEKLKLEEEVLSMIDSLDDYNLFKNIIKEDDLLYLNYLKERIENKLIENTDYPSFSLFERDGLINRTLQNKVMINNQ